MKTLSIDACQRELEALEAAEQITLSLHKQLSALKSMDTKSLIKKAMPMLMGGSFSLDAIGLSSNFFEQIEQLEKLNRVARSKLRVRVTDDMHQLQKIADSEVSHGEM
ncbi:hypothetical protein CV742_18030 [Vibrio parahaemolyticus]|nr:hypothetical protein [Vibrio parahaemolyticus]